MKSAAGVFLKDRKKLALLAGAVIAVAGLLANVIAPRVKPQIRIGDVIKIEESSLKKKKALYAVRDSIRKTYAELKPFLDLAGKTDEKQIRAALLQEIEQMVTASGASLVSISPRKTPLNADGVEIYYADIVVDAGVQQLVALFDLLNKSSLLVTLENFSIAAKEKDAAAIRLEGSIGLMLLR
ncbi:MAG: hypothetical protein NC924_01345 [Candidatus Omnitrophica bacterium]|nr:hypothetical protein [Candidatus Omnitrophota bacterium]